MDIAEMRGGRAYRQHQTLKEFIRARDGYTCQLCGAEGWIVDHIMPWRVSHDSTLGNLRVLCHKCNLKTRRQRQSNSVPVDRWREYLERIQVEG